MRIALCLIGLCLSFATVPAQAAAPERWIESWGTALPLLPAPPSPFGDAPPPQDEAPPPAVPSPFVAFPEDLSNRTVRMIVRSSVGGPEFRLEFANRQQAEPVTFTSIHAALAMRDGAIDAKSDRTVTFNGQDSVTLFPGARVVSDPVQLALAPLTELAVSIHLPDGTTASTVDALALTPSYIAENDQTANAVLDNPIVAGSYFWLRGLTVPAPSASGGTIVAFGDSITEGYATTSGAHQSWPELLAERLQEAPGRSNWAVVNTGISGNRVLRTGAGEAAVARFTEDVISRPGVKWVILLEAINDINMSIMPGMPASQGATADQIIAGLDQMVTRAHLHGIRVAVGTVTPTMGLPFYTPHGEAMRQEVNEWIRSSDRFDMVVDFDAALRDPANPLRLRPAYDSGDHVHPNDKGNQAMADAVDLEGFCLRSACRDR